MNNKILPLAVFEPHFIRKKDLPIIYHMDKLRKAGVLNLHENLEVIYVTRGSGKVLCGDETVPVQVGDTSVIDCYAAHSIVPDGEIQYFCLIIDRSFCKYHSIDPWLLHFAPLIQSAEAGEKMKRVMEACEREEPFQNAAIKSAVLELMVFLCRFYSEPKTDSELAEDAAVEHVRSAIEYIKNHFDKKLSVDEVAAHTGLSKYYFLRIFKRVTGYTMTQYINRIRCEYAKELLKSGKHSIKEVALLCGFENYSYFTNVFKQHMGVLPSAVIK